MYLFFMYTPCCPQYVLYLMPFYFTLISQTFAPPSSQLYYTYSVYALRRLPKYNTIYAVTRFNIGSYIGLMLDLVIARFSSRSYIGLLLDLVITRFNIRFM